MRRLAFILVLLWAGNAWAVTERVVYVDTDGSNGDGSVGSPYSSLYNALNTETKDLVSNDRQLTIYVQGAANDTTAINTPLDAFKGLTDSTRYIRIVGRDSATGRHQGKYDDGRYQLTSTGDQVIGGFTATADRLDWRIEGFQLSHVGTGTYRKVLLIDRHPGDFYAIGMIMKSNIANSPSASQYCLDFSSTSATTKINNVTLINNIIYDCRSQSVRYHTGSTATYVFTAYNNTLLYSGIDGVDDSLSGNLYILCQAGSSSTNTVTIKNNILNDCVMDAGENRCWQKDYSNCTYTTSNNITSDTSSPDNTYDSIDLTFADADNDDFHLASGDTGAIDDGADLSGTFTVDVDNVTRSGTWDIGADEYVAASSNILLLKNAREN